MGGYTQSQAWDEKIPGVDLSGMMRPQRRGLLGALLGVGMGGSEEESAPSGMPSTPIHRIDDEINRTPRGGQGPQGNQPPDDHLARMQAEYDSLAPQPKRPTLKDLITQKISGPQPTEGQNPSMGQIARRGLAGLVTKGLPLALGAAVGGREGMIGAGQAEQAQQIRDQQNRQFEEQQRNNQRGRLLQEIEAERRTQEQERAANTRAQMQADALRQHDTEFQQAEAGRNQRLIDQLNQRDKDSQQRESDFQQRMQQNWDEFQQRQNKQGDVGTWQFGTDDDGKPMLFNSKTGQTRQGPAGFHPKSEKPTADEQRRADLATNMSENLDALEEIVKRRPDLFGPWAGRKASVEGWFGTGDKDIAQLKTIKEQMGMAMVGAHAMRNAQHVETAGNSILNGMNNEPEAILSAIQAARNSLQTFQQDAQRAKGGVTIQSGGGSTRPSLRQQMQPDPLGIMQ